MNDKDEMIDRFERNFWLSWDDPALRTERLTWTAAWKAAKASTAIAADGKWYMLSRDGMATLCADRDDAMTEAASADKLYPNGAPHRALQLVAANAVSDGVASLSSPLQSALDVIERWARDAYVVCGKPATRAGFEAAWKAEDADAYSVWVAGRASLSAAEPADDAIFEFWWADHMPNATQSEAWAEWCALRSNHPAPALTQGAAIAAGADSLPFEIAELLECSGCLKARQKPNALAIIARMLAAKGGGAA